MNRASRIGRIGLVALVAASSLGCSKDAEGPTGQGPGLEVERENSGDADVEISDGNIEVSDGEGGSVEINAGDDAALPDGFPSDLEVPGTTNIIQATTSDAGDSTVQSVTLQFEGSAADAYDAYKAQLEGAGYVIGSDSSGTTDGDEFGNALATKDATTVSATFAADGDGNGTASISVQIE